MARSEQASLCVKHALKEVTQGKNEKVQQMYEEALKIRLKAYGEKHESVAENLNNLAQWHESQVPALLLPSSMYPKPS